MKASFLVLAITLLPPHGVYAQTTYHFDVDASKIQASIQPTMWGIFFEDINFAADGGLYAELIKNRSFEFTRPLMGWKVEGPEIGPGTVLIINHGLTENNPRFARITVAAEKPVGLTNEGFRGMGLRQGERYNFSILTRALQGNMTMRIELKDDQGNVIGKTSLTPESSEGGAWKKQTASLTASATTEKGKCSIWFEGNGVVEIDMISLFPEHTWKNRPNGLRADLVQKLADLNPGFIRFPGGCIVEGFELDTRYQWKKTVGDVANRKLIINRWNTEFRHRLTPDYFQSFGLGFYEYFLLAEDLGAEPLPILSCGMACQFNSGEVVPLDQLNPYIQDAVDLIEFANGPASSTWGQVRADMGHPAPFNLKYIGVGNEQWGPQYIERYELFANALKSQYPDVTVVTGTGPSPDGQRFTFANEKLRALNAELIDEHYYRSPQWFLENATRYDQYPRDGAKIFAGEYAAHTKLTDEAVKKNNWESALAEAAFMTGLERNADVVQLCSYAPLFAHIEAWQWAPDLIWFNNLNNYGTPNYYVQKLFANNPGKQVIPITLDDKPPTGQEQWYASAVIDQEAGEIILKIVNTADQPRKAVISIKGAKKMKTTATQIILTGEHLEDVNSLEIPLAISPKNQEVTIKGKKLNLNMPPYSLNVIKISTR